MILKTGLIVAAVGVPVAVLGARVATENADWPLSEMVRKPETWWRRARFRAKLRADLEVGPEFLRDVGIDLCEAQAEAMRFFWEPVRLKPR
jgi:uncharacterized protein YjiS (DUF1127 family)